MAFMITMLQLLWSFQLLVKLSDGKFYFSEKPSNPTYVVRGGEAKLKWKFVCTGPGGCAKELLGALWHSRNVIFVDFSFLNKEKKMLPSSFGNYIPIGFVNEVSKKETSRYHGRVSFSSTNDTLVISKITEADLQVNYTCTLASQKRRQIFSQVKLEWAVPPAIRESSKPKRQDVELSGGEGRLSCEAHGKPDPFIAWMKDGRVIKNSTNDTTLLVREKAKYECRAFNMAGSDSYQVNVVGLISGETTPTTGTHNDGTATQARQGSKKGIIIAAIVGPLLLICLVIGIFLWICRRKKKERNTSSTSKKRPRSEMSEPRYESIHMDQRDSPHDTVREKPSQESLENGYVEAKKDLVKTSDNQYESVNGAIQQNPEYASVQRKAPQKGSSLVSADQKTAQTSGRPNDEYAQVDMSKKKKKRKPGELLYADLDLAEGGSDGPVLGRKRPPAERAMYAEVVIQDQNRPDEQRPLVQESEYSNTVKDEV